MATAGAEAATVGAASAVVVSTVVVVVSTEEVSEVAVSMVVDSTAALVSVGDVSPVAVSMAVAFVGDVLMGATSTITGSLTMSSSAASAFQGGGAGTIRTDITVTAITRTITMAMDTAGTRTAMDTAGTVTTVAPVMDIAMEADQGIPGVRGVGDKHGYGSLKFRRPVGVWRSNYK